MKIVSFILVSMLFVLAIQPVRAQGKIRGAVFTIADKPVDGANVLLLNKRDSVLIRGTVTSGSGVFHFEDIKPGLFIISASFTGFKTWFSKEINVDKEEIN